MDLQFSEILEIENCPVEYVGDADILDRPVNRIGIDSRKPLENCLYVAIRGENLDGHRFVKDAVVKGALAAVVDEAGFETLKNINIRANFFIVSDTILALQQIANYYRQKFEIPFLGITGTSGKTTTKEMMANVLSTRLNVLKTEGNLNNHIGVPLTLFNLKSEHDFALIEMGTNHFGEIARLAEIAEPEYGLITNVGRGHLEFLGSVAGVAKAKIELFQGLAGKSVAFVNADDPLIVKNLPGNIKNVVTYGIKQDARIKAEIVHVNQLGKVTFKVFDQEISLPIPGLHNVFNALAAMSVGLEFGLTVSEMKPVIENFQPHSKRMEVVLSKGVTIINDCYNANPDSTSAALSVLESMESGSRKIAVLGDMLELGTVAEREHRLIGQLVSRSNIDVLFGYGQNSKYTVDEARKSPQVQATHFEDKTILAVTLTQMLKKGDVVLLKGSRGMAMETILQALTDEAN